MSFSHLINGKLVSSPKSFDVINPSTAKPFAKCPDASKEQLDEAVRAAAAAFPAWSQTTLDSRKQLLQLCAKNINENAKELALILAQEQGKPLAAATGEIMGAAYWFISTSQLDIHDEIVKTKSGDVRVVKRPLGVVGAITPWNFPVMLAVWKIAPALLAGNTIVLKPSPYTPLSTLKMGQVLQNVFPPGVLNIVAGGDLLGQWITTHPTIRKISFTGSTATGKKIREVTSKDLKVCTLELGGNDAAILMPGVDVSAVAAKIFGAAFGNSGQVCSAIKRVYVHESQYEDVLSSLGAIAKAAKVGAYDEKGAEYGPLNNKMQFDKVKALVDDAVAKGARVVAGGAPLARPGYFFAPTILGDVKEGHHRIVDEEQFGPALPVLKYSTVDEAIARANNSPYGLGASIWAKNRTDAEALADRLEAGTVWVNQHLSLDPTVPFGGFKESGLGRENGAHGLEEYLQIKAINVSKL